MHLLYGLFINSRTENERVLLRFLPWFLLVLSFGTLIVYNFSVDVYLYTHPNLDLVESNIRTRLAFAQSNNATTVSDTGSNENSTADQTEAAPELNATTPRRFHTLADHFHASHKYPLATMLTGLLLVIAAIVYTTTSQGNRFRGIPRALVAFCVASLLQSKILFWMDDRLVLVAFLLVRVAEIGGSW